MTTFRVDLYKSQFDPSQNIMLQYKFLLMSDHSWQLNVNMCLRALFSPYFMLSIYIYVYIYVYCSKHLEVKT